MTAEQADVLDQAIAWRNSDPDADSRAELEALISEATSMDPAQAQAALDDLSSRFVGPLEFGTAGLRGQLGAGPHRMNRAVVIRAASGIGDYLLATIPAESREQAAPHVVVGYDARHLSSVFARDTAAVLTAAGCVVTLLPRALPTPVLSFAVQHLDCDAGIMVTASHNPPQDNGYKVYLGGRVEPGAGRGAQLVTPSDAHIAERIAAAPPAVAVPMVSHGWKLAPEAVIQAYRARAAAVIGPGPRELSIVATPLHGVGGATLARTLVTAGFAEPYLVPEQAAPDPDFPTVAFPNPEEPGALDLALAAAVERDADLVIANDPDADRCAVAIPGPDGWRALTGDELGWLIGAQMLAQAKNGGEPVRVATSIVSSQRLSAIAAAHGAECVTTLTGFKWLARVPGLSYAYEEALGYCIDPEAVRDKDGISAAVLVASLAAQAKAAGRSLGDLLEDLDRRHGVCLTGQLSVRFTDLGERVDLMARLRRTPPRTLAGHPVQVEDLAPGTGSLPGTDALRWSAPGVRVIVRPSGTEPKLKCYLEVQRPPATGTAGGSDGAVLADERDQAQAALKSLRSEVEALLGQP